MHPFIRLLHRYLLDAANVLPQSVPIWLKCLISDDPYICPLRVRKAAGLTDFLPPPILKHRAFYKTVTAEDVPDAATVAAEDRVLKQRQIRLEAIKKLPRKLPYKSLPKSTNLSQLALSPAHSKQKHIDEVLAFQFPYLDYRDCIKPSGQCSSVNCDWKVTLNRLAKFAPR